MYIIYAGGVLTVTDMEKLACNHGVIHTRDKTSGKQIELAMAGKAKKERFCFLDLLRAVPSKGPMAFLRARPRCATASVPAA